MKSCELLAAMAKDADDSKLADLSSHQEFDLYSRISILSVGRADPDLKETMRTIHKKFVHDSKGVKTLYQNYLQQQINPIWNQIFAEEQPWFGGLLSLPQPVFALEFPFRLEKPLLMRDDDLFHPIDNPVRKEHVFKKPMLSASSWKGLLRHVLWAWVMEAVSRESDAEAGREKNDSVCLLMDMARLFGSVKEIESENSGKKYGQQFPAIIDVLKKRLQSSIASGQESLPSFTGCLYFYPTFFSRLDLEIINPHDRRRRVGKNPIYLECVAKGDVGICRLAYVQMPVWSQTADGPAILAAKDMETVIKLLGELLHERGISAKRSSGYGLVAKNFPDGHIGCLYANFYSESSTLDPQFSFQSLYDLKEKIALRRPE